MRSRFLSSTGNYPGAWVVFWGAALIIAQGLAAQCRAQDGIDSKLDTGEIIVSTQAAPGSDVTRVEMTGIINAPPEIVWQIITDINNFKFFMPRTLESRGVAAEKIPEIVAQKPTQAQEVEKLLGPTPPDRRSSRIPGGKYTVYHYSNLNFPWPCRDRWYILKGIQDETRAAQHYYHTSWSLVIGNLKENSGEWVLEPYGANQTKAIYRLATDPGGGIPEFLVKQGTCSTLPQIIKAVRDRAAKLCRLR